MKFLNMFVFVSALSIIASSQAKADLATAPAVPADCKAHHEAITKALEACAKEKDVKKHAECTKKAHEEVVAKAPAACHEHLAHAVIDHHAKQKLPFPTHHASFHQAAHARVHPTCKAAVDRHVASLSACAEKHKATPAEHEACVKKAHEAALADKATKKDCHVSIAHASNAHHDKHKLAPAPFKLPN